MQKRQVKNMENKEAEIKRNVFEFQAVIEAVPDKGAHMCGIQAISGKSLEKEELKWR